MNFKETTVTKNYVYKGRILNLRKDDVILPDGKQSIREIIEHSGGCCVLCERDDKILFVKQYRYAYSQELLELPAGKINHGEDPMETAKRELIEECGIRADKLELLFTVYPTPGYTNEKLYIYKASGLSNTDKNLDDGEFLTDLWIDKVTVKKMLDNNEINDAKTLIALLYLGI